MTLIKTVATAKNESVYCGEGSPLALFCILRLCGIRCKNEIVDGQFQNASNRNKLLLVTMMNEIQPKVLEKIEFQFRGKSTLLKSFGFFGLSRLLCIKQNPNFKCWCLFSQITNCLWRSCGRKINYWLERTETLWLSITVFTNCKTYPAGYQNFTEIIVSTSFDVNSCWPKRLDWGSAGENQAGIFWRKRVWKSTKNFHNAKSSAFSAYQKSDMMNNMQD